MYCSYQQLFISGYKIIIKEEESLALSFIENITTIELSYTINNLDENSFIILSFIFDENLLFNIDIKNILNRTISNSSNIFLFYNELSKIKNGLLTIKITYSKENTSEEKNNSLLIFKLIESNSISILEKINLIQALLFQKKQINIIIQKFLKEKKEK